MDNGNGSGGNDDAVNWAALVISLVALLGTILQVLQQYYASAAGYSNCGESVMGKWHTTKRRTFRWSEFRFEVQFESPVIFVSRPSNTRGPVKDAPINYIEGTKDSLERTRAMLPKEEDEQKEMLKAKAHGVHTSDNERATWVTLLSQLQHMEAQSQMWQAEHIKRNGPQLMPEFKNHTLAVAVQAKKRSWDTMPADVKKPYATTTMCHLLEIAAMMGIYWKEFDRSRDRYRAEGNGYMLTGTQIPDLGIMFTFQISGKSRFEENRVIPVEEVKDLCCGFVPTIFQEIGDHRRLGFPEGETDGLSFLQFGSKQEISETMVKLECNINTSKYFLSDDKKHTHLFPVPFELIGMLGKTLHIPNTFYRLLPNPTPYHWDKNFFSMRKLVKEYEDNIDDTGGLLQLDQHFMVLKNLAEKVYAALSDDKLSPVPGYSKKLLNVLHTTLDDCDKFLKNQQKRDLLNMVVREHIQVVMELINETPEDRDGQGDDSPTEDKSPVRHFDELSVANPEERQRIFMQIYFTTVLSQVMDRAVKSYNSRKGTYASSTMEEDVFEQGRGSPSPPTPGRLGSRSPSPSRPLRSQSSSPPPGLAHRRTQSGPQLLVPTARGTTPLSQQTQTGTEYFPGDQAHPLEVQAATIWCTLVLRMLCWLILHDFNRKDVQIPKSELRGSRLPVYFA